MSSFAKMLPTEITPQEDPYQDIRDMGRQLLAQPRNRELMKAFAQLLTRSLQSRNEKHIYEMTGVLESIYLPLDGGEASARDAAITVRTLMDACEERARFLGDETIRQRTGVMPVRTGEFERLLKQAVDSGLPKDELGALARALYHELANAGMQHTKDAADTFDAAITLKLLGDPQERNTASAMIVLKVITESHLAALRGDTSALFPEGVPDIRETLKALVGQLHEKVPMTNKDVAHLARVMTVFLNEYPEYAAYAKTSMHALQLQHMQQQMRHLQLLDMPESGAVLTGLTMLCEISALAAAEQRKAAHDRAR